MGKKKILEIEFNLIQIYKTNLIYQVWIVFT